MEILLGTVCVCLFVILAAALWKYISLKRNLRRFSEELEKLACRVVPGEGKGTVRR